jgi:hypothetical protein
MVRMMSKPAGKVAARALVGALVWGLAALWLLPPGEATAATRKRSAMIQSARAFAEHQWTMTNANQTATCGPSDYESTRRLGTQKGLPYDWGGSMSIAEFDKGIADGLGAGSHKRHGIMSCTVGLDCSGLITQAWATSRFTTSTMNSVTTEIPSVSGLKPGDAFNKPGSHTTMFYYLKTDGTPAFFEAAGGPDKTLLTTTASWSYLNGYSMRRFPGAVDDCTGPSDCEVDFGTDGGTDGGEPSPDPFASPIPIDVPFIGSFDTSQSPYFALKDYGPGCQPSSGGEFGREYVFELDLPSPGTLSASVSYESGIDVDVYILARADAASCITRNDLATQAQVNAGTYYIVTDTWGRSAETTYEGEFELAVSFVPDEPTDIDGGEDPAKCSADLGQCEIDLDCPTGQVCDRVDGATCGNCVLPGDTSSVGADTTGGTTGDTTGSETTDGPTGNTTAGTGTSGDDGATTTTEGGSDGGGDDSPAIGDDNAGNADDAGDAGGDDTSGAKDKPVTLREALGCSAAPLSGDSAPRDAGLPVGLVLFTLWLTRRRPSGRVSA